MARTLLRGSKTDLTVWTEGLPSRVYLMVPSIGIGRMRNGTMLSEGYEGRKGEGYKE